MLRPSFSVVTLVVGTLVVFGAIVRAVRPFIPPAAPNALAGSPDPFLAQAAYQPVQWMPWGGEVFRRARREGRPVLLTVGVAWSLTGRQVDDTFFGDSEMGRYVSRTFVCTRIDGGRHPELLNAFFPFSRVHVGRLAGFQIIVLTPDGGVVKMLGRTPNEPSIDREALLSQLIAARRAADAGLLAPEQRNDERQAEAPLPDELPDGEAFHRALRRSVPPEGGFAMGLLRPLVPAGWRYLALVGDREGLDLSVDPYLRSPARDGLDGSFFRLAAATRTGRSIEMDITALSNAETACALATAATVNSRPDWRVAARAAADDVLERLCDERIAAAEIGTVDRAGRSPIHSYPPRRLREILDDEERTFARDYLGLDVALNPQCIPYPSRPGGDEAMRRRVIAKLVAARPPGIPRSGGGNLATEARVVARLLEAARLLGDEGLQRRALDRADLLNDFRRGGAWVAQEPDRGRPLGLSDRIAVADAAFQNFLLTGRVTELLEGSDMLAEAIRLHRRADGVYGMAAPETRGSVPGVHLPEIADNTGESASAVLIRLLMDYGRLEGDSARGRGFLRDALFTARRFRYIATGQPTLVAGYYAACAAIDDDAHVITVGPNAVALAGATSRLLPTRLVAPAVGPVHRDMRTKVPGVYTVVHGMVAGPFTPDRAASELGIALRSGVEEGVP